MIEKIVDNHSGLTPAQKKINELIEASNRQDRAIAFLLATSTQYRSLIAASIGDEAEFYYREIDRG